MRNAVLVLIALGFLAGCTNESATRNALQSAGYSKIEAGGYSFFGCAKDEIFATKFGATNPSGQRVNGVVCCGLLKGCTIRF